MWGPIFKPFFLIGTKNISGSFSVPASAQWLCKGPLTMQKFPQKCHKIAGFWENAAYGSRPLIASKSGSSPLVRPGLDNLTSQPWSDSSYSPSISSCTLSCPLKQKERDKAEVSMWRGITGTSCVRPWLTRAIVLTGSFRRVWARFRGDRRSGTINGTRLTPGYLLALLQELLFVLRGLEEIFEPKQVRKTNLARFLYQIQKKSPKIGPHVEHKISLISFSIGSGPPWMDNLLDCEIELYWEGQNYYHLMTLCQTIHNIYEVW